MPTSPTPRVSRRALLAGAVSSAAVLATGCDALGPSAPAASPTTPGASGVPPVAGPDRVLVTEAAEATSALVLLLKDPAHVRPRLGRRLAPLLEMHRAHERVLAAALADTAGDASASPSAEAGTGPVGLEDVLAREQAFHDRLVAATGSAADGAVARLLAVLAAGLGQQLSLLSALPNVTAADRP